MTQHFVGCSGKKRFATFDTAEFAAKRMRQKIDDACVAAYHCKHCGGAHIGEARDHGRRNPKKDALA